MARESGRTGMFSGLLVHPEVGPEWGAAQCPRVGRPIGEAVRLVEELAPKFVPGGVLLSPEIQPLLSDDDRVERRWDFVLNVGRRADGASCQFWVVFQGLLEADGAATWRSSSMADA